MRAIILKLFCWLYIAMTVNSIADINSNIESKNAYINSELKRKLSTKSHHNRYASVMMANSKNSKSSSTATQRPWFYLNSYSEPSNSKYSYSNLNSVHLRHSKFPNLDDVMTRLDKMQTTRRLTSTVSTTTTTTTPKYRYQKYKSDNFLDNIDDSADQVDYEDNDVDADNLPDYDSWDNVKDDEDDLLDDEDGWQAEEATEATVGSITEFKWQLYGTRSRVEESRRSQSFPEHSNSNVEINAAIQHAVRMNKESRCRDPLPRVLSVQNIHPDPGKSYLPHCTVLHRCSADTGCCPSHSKTCAPKTQILVYLYFYTTTIGQTGSKVEKLPFYNHTECACLDKSVEPTTLETSSTEATREGTRSYRSNLSVRAADSILYSPETIRRCKCPEEYNSLLNHDKECSCDCANNNVDCIHIKQGNEYFSLKDRLCIINGECGVPKCEYGAYMRNKGRCPQKQEKLNAFASVSSNFK